jgi:ubiquinone/menaquinone biosynthesis C-methylase UbiE
MLRLAREKILQRGIENFWLVRGEAESLPFLPRVFDSVCMMMSFHHFADPDRATREIHRTLKPGGSLSSLDPILNDPKDSEDQRLNEAIEEAFQEAHGPDFRFFTIAQLQELYRQAGLTIESCQVNEVSFNQKGIEGIPMGPHWNQVRENLWFRRETALLKRYEEEYFNFRMEGGQVVVKGRARWAIIRAVRD